MWFLAVVMNSTTVIASLTGREGRRIALSVNVSGHPAFIKRKLGLSACYCSYPIVMRELGRLSSYGLTG